jgi:hypothetical protein
LYGQELALREHKAGPTLIRELALRLYPSAFESFREAISNAFDEGSKKVAVACSKTQIVFEDWGRGIADIETFFMAGQDSKVALGGETIGQKGLGKLALLRLKDEVDFRTNNGEVGIQTTMKIAGFTLPDYKSANRFVPHQGTLIIIKDPDLAPSESELAEYLKRIFGLRIANGYEITLNGAKLDSKLDPKEDFLFRLKGGVDVTGNLKQEKSGKGSADLYVRHVFIKSLMVDPERTFKGWVNCNALIPSTNRNDVMVDEPIYLDFIDHLRQYVARKFPRRDEDLGKAEVTVANELSRMLQRYLNHMNVRLAGSMPFGRGQEEAMGLKQGKKRMKREVKRPEKPTEREEEELKAKLKTKSPIRRTRRNAYGFNELWLKEGNEKEPYYFCEPNFTVYNTTNDLYKFAMKSKQQLGPKSLRFLPWLARCGVNMNPDSKKWDKDRFNMEVDRAMRYYLTQMGEITD